MGTGYFITFEGGEGAGKTSVISLLSDYLRKQGYEVVTTREPGGIPIAEQIRGVILDKSHTSMDGRTEALLYAAARRQHLVEKVIPALRSGKVVLCDRFIDSSLAYQGYARGLGLDEVLSINSFAIDGWMPQLTVYLDLPPEVGLARIQADVHREVNRLDLEAMSFHQRVKEGYEKAIELFPERIVRMDANKPLEQVFGNIRDLMNKILGGRI